jgi:hypothetical protein
VLGNSSLAPMSGVRLSISYTSYNKPSSITQGSGTLFFPHEVGHQRFKQVSWRASTFISGISQWQDCVGAGEVATIL